ADEDRQLGSALPYRADPPHDGRRIEAELADDVRRVVLLLEHRLDRLLVADERVALGVAGDAALAWAVPHRSHRLEQVGRALELAGRPRDVAGVHEHLVDSPL